MTAKLPGHERGRRQALRDIASCSEPKAQYLSRLLESIDFEIRLRRTGRSHETLECLYAHKGTITTWIRNNREPHRRNT